MKKYIYFGILSVMAVFLSCSSSEMTTRKKEKKQKIEISTSMGEILIELHNETPLHRDNMIKLVKDGFYEELLFHRVIDQFMIQGGDPDSKGAQQGVSLGNGGPGYTVPAEFNEQLFHKKGALAAARLGDRANPEKASSGSQFYIVVGKVFSSEELEQLSSARGLTLSEEAIGYYTTTGGTPHLDGSYTVYGQVIEGLEVVDRISKVKGDRSNRPLDDIIFSIKLKK